MTLVFKLILLASFIGLAIIVVKNRLANPQMRVQFFEDLEMNKRRLRNFGATLNDLGSRSLRALGVWVGILLPRLKQGGIFLWHKFLELTARVKKQLATQTKELRQDMKSLEVPSHKEDFLDKLDGGPETPSPLPIKEEPVVPRRSLGERFLGIEEEVPVRQSEIKPAPRVQGFRVTQIQQTAAANDIEVDKDILMKKEKWLLYAIAKNPKNANFYKKLGRIYLQMNNQEDAKNCFEYAVRLGSQDPEVRSLLSQLRHGM